jgi:ferrous iron transport protein B
MIQHSITALAGKPNSGKTSLFNALTGLNQKVGNFTGVTVDKASGKIELPNGQQIPLLDLPGTYSLFPKSEDEAVTAEILSHPSHPDYPNQVLVVADAMALRNSLLLCSQIMDTGIPCTLVVNMTDLLEKSGKRVDFSLLSQILGIPVFPISVQTGFGLPELKRFLSNPFPSGKTFGTKFNLPTNLPTNATEGTPYQQFIQWVKFSQKGTAAEFDHSESAMIQDMLNRYARIDQILEEVVQKSSQKEIVKIQKADRWLTHPIGGYIIFLLALTLMFQAIFAWAEKPMEWIELLFAEAGDWIAQYLPEGHIRDLTQNGILSGIGGIIVFVPQIAFLYLFIAVLEESGYMARVVFLMDRIMCRFGLNGRSIIPLIGGMACAIPSIMSARGIPDKKERLITILVTPLMSCSARIPVYTLLISLVIPEHYFLGVINLRGLIMLGLYLLGFVMALIVALILKNRLQKNESYPFILELPLYRIPSIKNIFLTVAHKCRAFVWEAGRIIMIISIALWFLISFGPEEKRQGIINRYETEKSTAISEEEVLEIETQMQADLLEVSYAGYLGKGIEPLIRPLGFDWKIGIGLIASFAAREVFVGTMATLYASSDASEESITLKEQMSKEVFQDDGTPVYTLATGIALILFYAFAMQCMSTLAITKRETGSWKWPLFMLVYLTVLAWMAAWIAQIILG